MIAASHPAFAADGFPFGLEMRLEAAPKPGSKRLPSLDIDDNGTAQLDLWCKSGKGQFAIAADTVVFSAGTLRDDGCSVALAAQDDDLLSALSQATNWKRQGDVVTLTGPATLRFRINTN
jgi:hypothetical protein